MATEGRKTTGKSPKPVRVWGEVGVTLAVSQDPPQFVKFTFGHERIAPTDRQDDIAKTEALIHEYNERIVNKRIKQYKRMIAAASDD